MGMAEHWQCPYCNRDCVITDERVHIKETVLAIENVDGPQRLRLVVVVCPNPSCRKWTLRVDTAPAHRNSYGNWDSGKVTRQWQLMPEPEARPFPNYIPEALRADYKEACLIKEKSPKASATLSRRCLQGMIRDFWGIKKGRLFDEIEALRDKVDTETWQAIDSVRQVGNIGAHMEKDVNVIVDVEPVEASLLIWLIETLFKEWYIARHDRQVRMTALAGVAEQKRLAQKGQAVQATANGDSGGA